MKKQLVWRSVSNISRTVLDTAKDSIIRQYKTMSEESNGTTFDHYHDPSRDSGPQMAQTVISTETYGNRMAHHNKASKAV